MTEFSRLLREARNRANLTQLELAERVGIDNSYISKIEKGGDPPARDKVLAIIDALGITDARERTRFLLAAGCANASDLKGLFGYKDLQSEWASATGTFPAPILVGQKHEDQQELTFCAEMEQIIDEADLPYGERTDVQRIILEVARTICRVKKESLEN